MIFWWNKKKVYEICFPYLSHQIFYFLFFYVTFYISRHIFSQIIKISALSEKNIFVTNFPFLMDSLKPQTPHPLNSQNPLSVTKIFCWCSLIAFFFRTTASTVILTKSCNIFEACTWTISEFDTNLPIYYNIAVRRYDSPKISARYLVPNRRNHSSKS